MTTENQEEVLPDELELAAEDPVPESDDGWDPDDDGSSWETAYRYAGLQPGEW